MIAYDVSFIILLFPMVQETAERRSLSPDGLHCTRTTRVSRNDLKPHLTHYHHATDTRLRETLKEYKSHCKHLNSAAETYHRPYVSAITSKVAHGWQLVKRKQNICVYQKHRKRPMSPRLTGSFDEFENAMTPPTSVNRIKASGHLHGTTVQELLRGVLATTTTDLKLTSSMLHPNSFVDAHIVGVEDNDTTPFNTPSAMHTLPEYQGFLSLVFKFPGIPVSLLRYRQFTCFNRIGTVLDDQSGETYGYYMLEAVDLPMELLTNLQSDEYQADLMEKSFHDDGPRETDSMERHLEEMGEGCWSKRPPKCQYSSQASLSFTWLLKQTKQDLVEVFVFGDYNLEKWIAPRLEKHFVAQHILSYLTNAQSCYQAKLCTLVLTDPVSRGNFRLSQHANRTKHRRKSFVSSEFETLRQQRRQVCSVCSVKVSPLLLSSITSGKGVRYGKILHCQACSHPVCRRCSTDQTLFSKALLTKWSNNLEYPNGFSWKHSKETAACNRYNDTEMSSLDPLVAFDIAECRWSDLQVDYRHFGRISNLNFGLTPNSLKDTVFSSLPSKGVFCLECICTLLPHNIASRVLLMNRQQHFMSIQRKFRYVSQKSRYSDTNLYAHNCPIRAFHASASNQSDVSQPSFCIKAQETGWNLYRLWHVLVALLKCDRKEAGDSSLERVVIPHTGFYEEEGQYVLDTISPSTLSIARTTKTIEHAQGSIRFTSMSRTRESLEMNRRIASSEMDEEMYSLVSFSEDQI
uniref:AlNc14C86G5502 protein n=1 Tax=Albugo laibachii Nc14 TaxID=890382 RepID=F0WFW7_9STRA|nr:AlNc14C86G5502 [Albugo laibachii Nc14]|eukprot:CCA20101.1 AlNc14C86G5502 [Albugo laibachii Nc14]